MHVYPDYALYTYIASAALFILSLQWMSQVSTSRRGNWAGALGMVMAVIATLMATHAKEYELIAGAIIVGTIIGAPMALKMHMTAVPQRTALSHAFGSLSAALVGTAEYLQWSPHISGFTMAVLAGEMILGYLTFTGSLIAFGKLQEILPGKPLLYRGRNLVSFSLVGAAIVLAVMVVIDPSQQNLLFAMCAVALVFGTLLVTGIGGADMPTLIAILNSYAGLSAAGLGFVLNNKLLIVAGALDGSSGLILAVMMCRAMNRSFVNVLFGGLGGQQGEVMDADEVYAGKIKQTSADEVAMLLNSAGRVVFVPGYGMAVAQAQHAVRDLTNILMDRSVEVEFGIHPVAGRMPGHMNVLLAEADVSYELLKEMDEINPTLAQADVVVIIGANDVVNPLARTDPTSPIAGMPIIEADRARTVVVIKRSLSP
ncbi:MAG TPA: NAD(P)(+) transhydrogenase (Re/Si-specific) subunit beta, partial [Kofleriaceae bacterium]|nr:NAD(P)(+) transhydrogenase (Re/Si-specific) subunit beta [Kofleriaceae bacterium]